MKIAKVILSLALAALSTPSFAQSATDIINQTQDRRSQQMSESDERNVTWGFYGEYTAPGEKEQGSPNAAFTVACGAGLSVFKPVFSSGDGTNFGDTNGDLTLAAGWKGWASNSGKADYPNWNTYTAVLGFRLSFGGMFFVEPHGGYTYGTYSTGNYKIAKPDQVSGVTYGGRAGFTVLKGFDFYAMGQCIQTKEFGSPVDLSLGLGIHF